VDFVFVFWDVFETHKHMFIFGFLGDWVGKMNRIGKIFCWGEILYSLICLRLDELVDFWFGYFG